MEALGTLAGGVAHDLNNVLGIVVGYSELLLHEPGITSAMRSYLTSIKTGSEGAAAIVQDLLTLARRGVAGKTVLNLNALIRDSQNSPEFLKLLARHPSVKVRIDLESGLLNVSGSSVHLTKTIFNLMSNANEAMPNGGVLTVRTGNRYLDRPVHGYEEVREGDYVVLSVSDTGEGIPAADLKRIFEPFYTKKVMGRSGTGLGLSVVWGTVKDHDGYIDVESEEGKGSTFTIHLPASREDVAAGTAAVPMSEYMGKGESILVVDDVEGQRKLATRMLTKLNYRVESVASGEEAVAYLMDRPVDLMILDMIMDPGMDGLDTYRSVIAVRPGQKAIIVSGFSETDRVRAAQAAGGGRLCQEALPHGSARACREERAGQEPITAAEPHNRRSARPSIIRARFFSACLRQGEVDLPAHRAIFAAAPQFQDIPGLPAADPPQRPGAHPPHHVARISGKRLRQKRNGTPVPEVSQGPGGVHLPLGLVLPGDIKIERPDLGQIVLVRHGKERRKIEIGRARFQYRADRKVPAQVGLVPGADQLAPVAPRRSRFPWARGTLAG